MNIALLIAVGIALMVVGAGVTFLLASALPADVLQRAQDNGRFAGLTTDGEDESTGKRVKSAAPVPVYRAVDAG
jgi:hypothetical protein